MQVFPYWLPHVPLLVIPITDVGDGNPTVNGSEGTDSVDNVSEGIVTDGRDTDDTATYGIDMDEICSGERFSNGRQRCKRERR